MTLLGRAGKIGAAWGETTTPSYGDLDMFLAEVGDEIEAALVTRGAGLPLDATASGAIRGLNADGALILAIEATWPSDTGPQTAKEILRGARDRFEKGMDAIRDGSHTVVLYLGSLGTPLGSSDFWSTEPDYGLVGSREWADARLRPDQQPVARRGQMF